MKLQEEHDALRAKLKLTEENLASYAKADEDHSYISVITMPEDPPEYMRHEDPRLWRVKDEEHGFNRFALWWRNRRTKQGVPIQVKERLDSLMGEDDSRVDGAQVRRLQE